MGPEEEWATVTVVLDERALEERLVALEGARAWSPRVVSRLEALIRSGSDAELFRINPLRFAALRSMDEAEAIDLFLHATAAGLFGTDWLLQCPYCGCLAGSPGSLGGIHSRYHCTVCHLDIDSYLDDYIAVTFTLSPQVRRLAYHDPSSLSAEDYVFGCRLSADALGPGGVPWQTVMRVILKAVSWLPPGAETSLALDAEPGFLLGFDLDSDAGFLLTVEGETRAEAQTLRVGYRQGSCTPAEGRVAPGPLRILVDHEGGTRGFLGIVQLPPGFERHPLDFAPFLDGKRLLTTRTFADLFGTELVAAGTGLGMRDLTLLFTDLKGSTALYERIGDLNAFALVERHFEELQAATTAHGGVLVKTIGDAVMAAFRTPQGAVEAALAMRELVERVNRERGGRDLVLKIGLHKGAAIAVTLNGRLDYFGQTVNTAARVQALADADEIVLTAAVHDAPGVAQRLAGLPIEARSASLRGVALPVPVYRLLPAVPAATAPA
jgi:class 3 adenylate cyclase